jgi:hypothetical protein
MVTCEAGTGHCCWLGHHGVCPQLRDDGPAAPRRWVCRFRERLGSWEAVHADPEYRATVGAIVLDMVGVYCGDWPRPGESCAECGVRG